MKKLLVLLGIVTIVPAYAVLYENETCDTDTLREQGYSRSTLELVDTVKYHNGGKARKKDRTFQKREHHYLGKAYYYIKQYVDPAQDDGNFGEHQITFTNTWNGDNTKYSSEKVAPTAEVDNL